MSHPVDPDATVSFRDAVGVWAKIGLLSFGGPAGQVALMHAELVVRRKWIDEERFLHALNYCMLLPGPEAQQLAIYIGWLMHRTKGGLVAGILFVLPGFAAILALSTLYAGFHQLPAVLALFGGLKAAVLAVVLEALIRLGKRALKTRAMRAVAGIAFVALFLLHAPFPLVVFGAGVVGFVLSWLKPNAFSASAHALTKESTGLTVIDRMAAAGELEHTVPSTARALRIAVTCVLLWGAPIVLLRMAFGASSVFVTEGVFFSKAAAVTFGGAYAVLPYVAQRAVETYGWLSAGEMLDGLGLAETTPGPLIMVLQFVGYLGAYRNPGALSPWSAGLLGSCVTVWATFAPCFLWIFVGAPYIELLRGNRRAGAALSAVTSAAFGTILNLSLWFGAHVLFQRVNDTRLGPLHLLAPDWKTLDLVSLILASAATLALVRWKIAAPKVLFVSAVVGAACKLVLGA